MPSCGPAKQAIPQMINAMFTSVQAQAAAHVDTAAGNFWCKNYAQMPTLILNNSFAVLALNFAYLLWSLAFEVAYLQQNATACLPHMSGQASTAVSYPNSNGTGLETVKWQAVSAQSCSGIFSVQSDSFQSSPVCRDMALAAFPLVHNMQLHTILRLPL